MDLTLILAKRFPNQEWNLIGDDYEGLEWLSETPKPTKQQLTSQWNSVLAEIKAEAKAKETAKAAILDRIGLTADELKTILG